MALFLTGAQRLLYILGELYRHRGRRLFLLGQSCGPLRRRDLTEHPDLLA
jgi:polysaccharide pyruvyl transferase WcaK-like protein